MRKIVHAAIECLGRDASASTSEIAKVAGVGRVTLYSHFATREELVEAALVEVLAEGDAVLDGLDLEGDPVEVLTALIDSGWQLIAKSSALLQAAQKVLPPGRIQDLHARPAERVEQLIRRGQRDGAFRSDLPSRWMAAAVHHLIHGAATDVADGRLAADEAPDLVLRTVFSGVLAPGRVDA
ncbi:TetR/AcrR family transcriptional regulator [Luteipulveratus halotolerans]|uniref:TetR family transcriptional regulator n=1 Tax=Luteipulveratus halotolerans TaxID=1631356 RepID=A0A0L6CJ83_9MICO|nr:TetR/AcrR family transcriptional regulator [Luteipulveratus halotolerans]KNX37794.1 TetR family transcriptional regulator [Luteipulveratus halotolerans]